MLQDLFRSIIFISEAQPNWYDLHGKNYTGMFNVIVIH